MSGFDQAVRSDLARLEAIRERQFRDTARPLEYTRAAISRETRLAPGTLSNIRKQRTKGVRGWIADTIRGALVRELQREIERLNHELHILLQRGASHRDYEMEQVSADLARVRQSLEAMK